MLETLTIVTLSILALIYFRPGKTEPLQSALSINRVGQFSAVLAPMLNLAQPMLESVSRNLSEADRQRGNSSTLYFTVHDKDVKAHGTDYYLLAATLLDGVLYFQAAAPEEDTLTLNTIRSYAQAKLPPHTAPQIADSAADTALTIAIQAGANQRGALVSPLREAT